LAWAFAPSIGAMRVGKGDPFDSGGGGGHGPKRVATLE